MHFPLLYFSAFHSLNIFEPPSKNHSCFPFNFRKIFENWYKLLDFVQVFVAFRTSKSNKSGYVAAAKFEYSLYTSIYSALRFHCLKIMAMYCASHFSVSACLLLSSLHIV